MTSSSDYLGEKQAGVKSLRLCANKANFILQKSKQYPKNLCFLLPNKQSDVCILCLQRLPVEYTGGKMFKNSDSFAA